MNCRSSQENNWESESESVAVDTSPQFAEGFVAGIAGAKPKASDYEPTVQALLIRGMAEYSMRILTIKGFPPVQMQMFWAKECFRNACRAAGSHYSITERMIKLMTKRGSHVRSQIVAACRALFAPHYKFNRSLTSASAINTNRDLSAKLKDGTAYHYKDVEASTGYAGNSILADIRHAVVFKNKKSLGVIFASHFSPYPLPPRHGINQKQQTHTLLEATHSNRGRHIQLRGTTFQTEATHFLQLEHKHNRVAEYLTESGRIAPSRAEAEPSKITLVNMVCARRGI
ncbi:hypothetical protein B0H13DRAFT_1927569, partial [Mycena leptocephala]